MEPMRFFLNTHDRSHGTFPASHAGDRSEISVGEPKHAVSCHFDLNICDQPDPVETRFGK